jgi:inorganic phosphate transporter, PiT family
MGFIFLTSGLFLGWSLGANHHGNIFGAAVQTKMIKFKYAALIASIFVILGSVAEGSGGSATLNRLGSVNAAAGAFAVALSTAISVALMTKIKLPVSTSQAIVGAIIGWNLFAGMLTDYTSLISIVTSWVVAPVLAAAIAFGLYFLFRYYMNRSQVHLLKMDSINRWALLIFGAFGAYSLGANNIANVVGIFVSVSPFKDITLFQGLTITGLQQLYFWGALSIAIGIYTYSERVMSTVGTDLYKLSPITGLIVVISEALVLYLFGSKQLQHLLLNLHLPTIPLVPISSSQGVIGAVMGVGLAKGGKNIHFDIMGKISLGWITAPLLACALSFVLLFFVQNVFEQPVMLRSSYIFDKSVLLELQARNINLNYLTDVNGRQYNSARALRSNLDKMPQYSRSQKIIISKVSEIDNLQIDNSNLRNKLDPSTFSMPQWLAISKLDGKKYEHDWQLQNALIKLTGDWAYREKKNRNQIYNIELAKKYKILIEYSKITKPAPSDKDDKK